MKTLDGTSKCPRCGTPLSAAAVENLCPRCVMEQLILPPEPPSSGAEQPVAAARPFGSHDLIEIIGTGGMGVIWRARQRQLNRIVALKMIRSGLFASESDTKRFHAEVESVANLDHPNIVPVFEVGQCDGNWFFSMPLIEGESLAQRLDRARRSAQRSKHDSPATPATPGYDSRAAARLIATLAHAVHHAHQRGILHRDLKPGNILLDREGHPHITDFGLAGRTSGLSDLTVSGAVLGTPNYMSPEQASGKNREVTIASDIYGLGSILYELLTGQPPFRAETPLATLQKVVETEPSPPSSINHRADRQVEIICLKCLAKDPARRYATAEELAEDLERWLRHEPIHARTVSTREKLMLWARRRPAVAALAGLALLLFLGGIAGVVWQWRRANRHATETETALGRTREALWQANYDRAHALRTSGGLGRRVKALEAIRAAAAIRPTPELREEAIAALALVDLEDTGRWLTLPSNVTSLVVDASLRHYAYSLGAGKVEVRQFTDGQLVFSAGASTLTNLGDSPTLAFSTNGMRLLASTSRGFHVWDLTDGRELLRGDGTGQMALSADGRRVAIANLDPSNVLIRAVDEGATLARLPVGELTGLIVFSHDGRQLAVAATKPQGVQIWEISSARKTAETHAVQSTIGFAWNQDGTQLAIGSEDSMVYLWSGGTSTPVALRGHLREGVRPFFHPGGDLLASYSWDTTLRLWSAGAAVQIFENISYRPLQFSMDGQFLAVQGARGLGRLRVHLPVECRVLPADQQQKIFIHLSFSPDDRFIAGVRGAELRIWACESSQPDARQSFPRHEGVQFLDARTVLTDAGNSIHAWTNLGPDAAWQSALPVEIFRAEGGVLGGAFNVSRDHGKVVANLNGVPSVFDLTANPVGTKPLLRLAGQAMSSAPRFSPDGRWIASGYWNNRGGYGSEMALWSATDGRPLRRLPMGNCHPHFSPDGRWFLGAADAEYQLYETRGEPADWPLVWKQARLVSSFVQGAAAFSPDGTRVAVLADERLVRILDTASGRELARLTPLASRIAFLEWSPGGRWLAAATQMGTHLWDLPLLRVRLREMNLDWE